MSWTVKATCDKCQGSIESTGPYYTARSPKETDKLTIYGLREAMIEHECYKHGGLR